MLYIGCILALLLLIGVASYCPCLKCAEIVVSAALGTVNCYLGFCSSVLCSWGSQEKLNVCFCKWECQSNRMFGSAACPSSSASSEFCSVGKPSAVSLCCSCWCRNGNGWPEPCPEDHCWESLLSCHSRCSASGKTRQCFLKSVLEERVAPNMELLYSKCWRSNSMCFYP